MGEHDHLEKALPGFGKARSIIKGAGDSLQPLDYRGTKFDFYRWVNRYRLALRFEGVRLEGFGEDTVLGYSALTRTFLAWSVFERYGELAGDPPPYRALLAYVPKLELSRLADHIDRHDRDGHLFDFLHGESIPLYQGLLDRFRGGNRRAVVAYAASLRHIYVHGHLTAHPNNCTAEDVASIADVLSTFLLDLTAKDFARRVKLEEASAG